MRIISGELKGRQLRVPREANLRPTTDRVRTSLFDSLEQLVEFRDCVAVDLYSGSGSLAFEALSRGVRRCTLVEKDRLLLKHLTDTAAELGLQPRAQVSPGDVRNLLPQLAERMTRMQTEGDSFVRLILADPPYTAHPGFSLMRDMLSAKLVVAPTVVAIGRPRQLQELAPGTWPADLAPQPSEIRVKDFGDTQFDIFLFL